MYIYMLHNKNEALEAFKVFKVEVEKQFGKYIKIVRIDRGEEYYCRYTENVHAPGPFAKFLQEQGIVAQYTMLEIRFYNLHEKKLDSRTISGYFIEYAEKSKRLVVIHTPQDQTGVRQPVTEVPHIADENLVDQVIKEEQQEIVDQPNNLMRSTRIRRLAISSDYVMDLQESYFNIGAKNDFETFLQYISCNDSKLWFNAMKEEMNSMAFNGVWNLVHFPDGVKAIGCKWVFKQRKTH
ncbi:uncharacterized protein [Primulina eburnea]|uniref:uncharacterized protein n=1 Tax=Primulina eburnea TaxID=1245227 RepID=UPI003C6C67FA